MMRALKNDGMKGASHYSGQASGLKSNIAGMHMRVLGPILQQMEFSDTVMMEPGMPCPLSPPIDLASIQMLPPSKLPVLGNCTPRKSLRFGKKITPEKLMERFSVQEENVRSSKLQQKTNVKTMRKVPNHDE